ncbi:MAG: CDP-glucose 4,6-dehydratase [Candidatus Heimdallarchaeota archaeon]|nr:MAG: CDP-glucose 4,6-dehydratase [Candidatus Heimdallarchaeota archaeon]
MSRTNESEISGQPHFPPVPNVYRNKTVLVTGHTGFKGTWLSIWLKALGGQVIGYSLEPNTQPSVFEVTQLENKITHIIGDIRDENHLNDVFQQYNPEFVFHLAAQSLVRESYKDPKLTYESNVIGLVYLFEVIRKTNSVRVVINVSSDKCYENKEWVWGYRENDPMGGYDPYSSSKGCSELITSAYRRSFFNDNEDSCVVLASARAGNVIGGGDWAEDRIIPDCIRSLTTKKPILIRNPNAIRPWQHVLEPLSGYLWLGALLHNNGKDYASGWNFGPRENQSLPVKEIVERMIQIWGEGSWTTPQDVHAQPHEANYLKLDCSKAYRLLKWQAIYDIHETIVNTINWYKSYYYDSVDMFDLCLKQITNYVETAKKENLLWASTLDIKPNSKV